MNMPMPSLNADRLWQRVQALSEMTLPEAPWTRRAFTPLFEQARRWLRAQMEAAGMQVHLDAGGNLIGRLAPRPDAPNGRRPLITGSHCDTVMMGGRFDGIIGVLAGIEVAHALHESGLALRHPLEVIDFLSEEPSDYGISCIGSRAFSGKLDARMLAATNPAGETLAEGLRRVGGDPQALGQPLRAAGSTAAFVELHIEQGPVLQTQGLPIGVVTHIVGIRRVRIVVQGQAAHAGTTPMHIRQDALAGAALVIDAARRQASAMTGTQHYVVATVGHLSLTPNASNAVPGRVEMMLEVRSDQRAVLDAFVPQLMAACAPALAQCRVRAEVQEVSLSLPTACDERVMRAIETAAAELDYPSMRMPSGAGHDAAYVAPTGPVGMVFVPCRDGHSHCPEEWLEPQQLLDGARVLCRTLMVLDETLD